MPRVQDFLAHLTRYPTPECRPICDNSIVIDDIVQRLQAYSCRLEDAGLGRRAAVLVPLYEHDGELHIVLTRRTDIVDHHKGEISFPGGGVDPTDSDLTFTALRESREEIGLLADHVRIVGQLDDTVTRTGFHISAIVGVIDPAYSPYAWIPQPFEVAEVLIVPLSHLADPANAIEVPRSLNGSIVLSEGFLFGEHTIWGATARILRNFLDVCLDAAPATVEPWR
jgi:8-oxo-dGTP pyrophosphatase MutT (NUDIX family)